MIRNTILIIFITLFSIKTFSDDKCSIILSKILKEKVLDIAISKIGNSLPVYSGELVTEIAKNPDLVKTIIYNYGQNHNPNLLIETVENQLSPEILPIFANLEVIKRWGEVVNILKDKEELLITPINFSKVIDLLDQSIEPTIVFRGVSYETENEHIKNLEKGLLPLSLLEKTIETSAKSILTDDEMKKVLKGKNVLLRSLGVRTDDKQEDLFHRSTMSGGNTINLSTTRVEEIAQALPPKGYLTPKTTYVYKIRVPFYISLDSSPPEMITEGYHDYFYIKGRPPKYTCNKYYYLDPCVETMLDFNIPKSWIVDSYEVNYKNKPYYQKPR